MARPTLTPAEDIFGEAVPTSERLLRAAADLFAEVGLDGVTLHDVARQAGVTTGAIYGNFGSKEKFLLAALAWIADTELTELASELRAATANEPLALLKAWAESLVDPRRKRHRRLLTEATQAARRNDETRELIRDETRQRTELLRRAFALGRHRGHIAADVDPDAARWFLHAVTVGMAHVDSLGIELPDHDTWETLLEHVFLGLRTELAAPPRRHPARFLRGRS